MSGGIRRANVVATMSVHLVGHDGTERGDDALALAMQLARIYGAELLAVHVVALPPARDRFAGDVIERLEADARTVLDRAVERAGGGVDVGTRVVFETSPAAGLQHVCADEGAALITVGSTHGGAVGRVLAGSTAERLITGAPCPVALAPRGHASGDTAVAEVVVGYDGGDEARLALDVASDLARRTDASIRVVSATEGPPAVAIPAAVDISTLMDLISERAHRMVAEGRARVPDGIPADGQVTQGPAGPALAELGESPGRMLVIGSRRYGALRGVLVGSVGHHLAHHAPCPVLIVPRGVETGRAGEMLAGSAGHVG